MSSKQHGDIGGIEEISLRTLLPTEVPEFIKRYIEMALERDRIKQDVELSSLISEYTHYPFTDDVINVLYYLSKGVQRFVCSYARLAIEKAVSEGRRIINVSLVMRTADPTYQIWCTMHESVPCHYARFVNILAEALARLEEYISDISFIGFFKDECVYCTITEATSSSS